MPCGSIGHAPKSSMASGNSRRRSPSLEASIALKQKRFGKLGDRGCYPQARERSFRLCSAMTCVTSMSGLGHSRSLCEDAALTADLSSTDIALRYNKVGEGPLAVIPSWQRGPPHAQPRPHPCPAKRQRRLAFHADRRGKLRSRYSIAIHFGIEHIHGGTR